MSVFGILLAFVGAVVGLVSTVMLVLGIVMVARSKAAGGSTTGGGIALIVVGAMGIVVMLVGAVFLVYRLFAW